MVVSAHKEEKSDLETSGTDPRMQLFRRTLRASINFGCHGIGQASGLREAFFSKASNPDLRLQGVKHSADADC